jgi:outer membrane protein assembly factor BamB
LIIRGDHYQTQIDGQTVVVRVIEHEQRTGSKRGKWVCLNPITGRKLWRTTRQLHGPVSTSNDDKE